jgi:RNA polymerase sigma-70 factor (TIGR02943 family)
MNSIGPDISEKHKIISQWVYQYGDALYSWAFHRTSDEAVASDLVQDTFVSAFEHFQKFHGASSPKTWLFSILKNKVTDHFRKTIRTKCVSLRIEEDGFFDCFDQHGRWKKEFVPQAWDGKDDNLLDDNQFQNILTACMGKLPSSWAACMQLKYLSEKKSDVICQQLHITPSNFWQILHRAKLHLRACLEKNWFKSF